MEFISPRTTIPGNEKLSQNVTIKLDKNLPNDRFPEKPMTSLLTFRDNRAGQMNELGHY
jgi:hypothetical protein